MKIIFLLYKNAEEPTTVGEINLTKEQTEVWKTLKETAQKETKYDLYVTLTDITGAEIGFIQEVET